MKKIFLTYLKNQLAQNEKLRASNSIAEEDRVILDEQVAGLNEVIELIEAEEDATVSQEMVDELKASLETLSEAVTAIKERINTEKKEEEPDMELENKNYLSSKNSIDDFAKVIRNSKTTEEFKKNWEAVLVQNGITIASGSEEAYLPQPVVDRIQDAFDRENEWLSKLHWTGAKRFYARYNDATDLDSEDVRAKGHKRGDTKAVQSFQLSAKLIEPQMIYKIAQLDNQTIFETSMDLINYVVDEIVNQISYEIRRAVLVGDGRAVDSDYKINKIISIASHTTTDGLCTVSTAAENGFLIDDIRAAVRSCKGARGRNILVFMSSEDFDTLARYQSSDTANPLYMEKAQVEGQLGTNVTIVETDMLGSDYKAICLVGDAYYMVGQNISGLGLTQWEDYMKNLQNWRGELMIGGDLVDYKSAAIVKAS